MANPDIKIRSTIPFKLKDKPGREYKIFNLKTQFGFIPEQIIIGKVKGSSRMVLSAVLTDNEKAKIIEPREKIKVSKKSII